MKKVTLAIALAALVLFAGCKKDTTTTMTSTLKASIEQNQGDGSRTALNPTNGAITWNAGDQILVSNGSSTKTFTLTGEAGQTIGTFTCSGDYELGTNNMAVYPATGTFGGTTLSFTLPAEQNGGTGTFANGANPMLAVSETDNLVFTSLCGVLGLSLTGDNIAITAIEIVDNGTGNSSMLSGDFTADCTASQPVLAYAGNGGTNSVRLNCATTLTTSPQEFYLVLPVGTLASANGFTLNLYNGGADPIYSKTRGAALEMQYNTVRKMNELTVTLAPVVTAPEVTTGTATAITADGATCAGTVTSDGNGILSAYGICYSKTDGFEGATGTPVAGGDMDGAGDFSADLTGLDDGTTYYFRAFATNEEGTAYGDIASFETPVAFVAPTVTTGTAEATTAYTATGHVTLTDAGTGTVTEIGLCWGTTDNSEVNPTAANFAAADGQEVGTEYMVDIEGLGAETTYYVRGYAKVGDDYYYAAISVSFTTSAALPVGVINGLFSVSATQQVYFSQGNLKYTKSTGVWSFMEHQYDIVETLNQNVGENYANQDVVSLFGWGTSGYNHGASAYQPWSTYTGNYYYQAYGTSNFTNLYDGNGQADWGYNAISNGGNQENCGWRTLTSSEWSYIVNTRSTTSGIRYAKASVNGVNGMILLPDNWTASIYALNNTNGGNYNSNTITAEEWTNMLEANGAVFLPATGMRSGTNVNDTGDQSFYWSSSCYDGGNSGWALGLYFGNGDIYAPGESDRYFGGSVRLVRNVQ